MKTIRHKSKHEWQSMLAREYYIVYGLTIILFGVAWYLNYSSMAETGEPFMLFDANSTIGKTIQYVIILYTLAAIPGALYWFKRKCISISKIEEEDNKYDLYYIYAQVRMGIIALAMPMSIIAYLVLGAYRPMIWLAAIAALAFVFTKPTASKAEDELSPQDENLKY